MAFKEDIVTELLTAVKNGTKVDSDDILKRYMMILAK